MKASTVFDCNILQLPRIYNPAGSITAVNNNKELPFSVERIYYLFDVPGGEARGGHAHKNLYQLIVVIVLGDGFHRSTVHAQPGQVSWN